MPRRPGAGAVPVPGQGARAGPGARAHALGVDRPRHAIYDGDTPREQRAAIRRRANVVLTNPDMLHLGILPNHRAWADFFANLALVVVDEAHVYRGVFGSHVANVLRRLRRVAAAYGTEPRFVLASATIANPAELAERLTGLDDFTVVDERRLAGRAPHDRDVEPADHRREARHAPLAAGRGGRPARRARRPGRAHDRVHEVAQGRRADGEVRHARARGLGPRELASGSPPTAPATPPQQRREIERRLVEGELLGVVSTDALELGIDIGSLDAAICVTFPGTVASLRQMWGRAGRRGRGLAVYVAGEDALDQFFCRHPDEFLDRPVEAAILDPENEQIHAAHVLCAAHEGPLDAADAATLGPGWRRTAEVLEAAGELRRRPNGTYVPRRTDDYPAAAVSLRSAGRDSFAIVDTGSGELLGTVDAARAHNDDPRGRDLPARRPLLRGRRARPRAPARARAPVPRATGTRSPSARPTRTSSACSTAASAIGVTLSFGTVVVTEQVLAYQKKRLADHEAIDLVALDLPQTSFMTQALWYELGPGRHLARSCR